MSVDPIITVFSLIVLLFSVVIHELAHGSVAYSLGDPTAKYQGRLTLNPIKHLDPFGSVILPLLLLIVTGGQGPIFGWAKPVPVNPHNFRDQKWGSLKVALAGPLSNLSLALLFGLLIRFIPLSFFNLMPGTLLIFSFIVQINIILALFNLLPIPPLDGHWILFYFLPESFYNMKAFLQQYGVFILILIIFFGGLGGLYSLVESVFGLITGL
ncbi:MAG: site-2 protease family protein [Candidatus Staskawiczbacteria bacterium]|nr:site-2 protease family protein [Candidatus Staskawiczbacteria bacterium]